MFALLERSFVLQYDCNVLLCCYLLLNRSRQGAHLRHRRRCGIGCFSDRHRNCRLYCSMDQTILRLRVPASPAAVFSKPPVAEIFVFHQ